MNATNNPLLQAFFIGRALAETLNEQAENAIANALSDIGKFDAEQREKLRQFTEQVLERANREAEVAIAERQDMASSGQTWQKADLQATLDDLRAEIARLRTELKNYRSRSRT